jgi:hypothetical protein
VEVKPRRDSWGWDALTSVVISKHNRVPIFSHDLLLSPNLDIRISHVRHFQARQSILAPPPWAARISRRRRYCGEPRLEVECRLLGTANAGETVSVTVKPGGELLGHQQDTPCSCPSLRTRDSETNCHPDGSVRFYFPTKSDCTVWMADVNNARNRQQHPRSPPQPAGSSSKPMRHSHTVASAPMANSQKVPESVCRLTLI